MYDIKEQMIVPQYYLGKDEQGQYVFSDEQAAEARQMLDRLAFWAAEMKPAREKLAQ